MIANCLQGIRILDFTNVLSGPFGTHQLVHLGAEVIKVERPGKGDLARQLGADAGLNRQNMGVSFLAQNAGKKSVTVNLKTEAGRDLARRLAAEADVVVENFRPGVMDRLGLGAETLRARHPRLIYCALTGYGQTGPWVHRPAYDQIVQGVSGVMAITGTGESGPLRAGYPVADTIGGLTMAFAIAAALNAPERGGVIDVSMLEATLATMGWAISNHLIAGVPPQAHGNDNPTSSPSGAFRTADGLLNIAANKDEQWEALARHLGRADLLERPEFVDREARKANRLRLTVELETVLVTQPTAHWVEALSQINVPAGPVLSVPEILSHPVIAERGMIASFEVETVDRPVNVVRTGFKCDGAAPSVSEPPPALGAHTDDILGGLGLGPGEIAALRAEGTI